jgi:hypothetical protein
MCRTVVILLLCGLAVPGAWAKSALDLMLEGRYSEAKAILDATVASPRYQLMYFALTESEAARACSLYQVIAIRYPNTDCDSVARVRLDQAREMGVMVVPINEWADAPAGVKPLGMRRVAQTAPPLPPPVVEAPKAAVKPVMADTMVHPSVSVRAPDTVQVSKIAIAQEKPTAQAVTLTVPFSKIEKTDSSKSQTADTTKKVIPPIPPKIAQRDTARISELKATKEIPSAPKPPLMSKPAETGPIALTPKIVAPQTQPVEAKPKVTEPVVSTPKVESSPSQPVEVKPKVAEPVVSTPKIVAPPTPPAPSSVAPAETLKAIKVETAKATSDTSAPKMDVKRVAVVHDKPMTAPGKWYIQVGAFGNFDNAHRLATTLQKAGYPIKLVPRDAGTKKLLQVRVGGYENRGDCDPVADELKSKYQVPTVIISE